jgi:hypothetical protein
MEKKSGKKLAVGILAAVMVLLAAVGLLIGCTGEAGSAQATASEAT